MYTGSLKPLLCCPRQILAFDHLSFDFKYPTFVTSFPLWNTKDTVFFFF